MSFNPLHRGMGVLTGWAGPWGGRPGADLRRRPRPRLLGGPGRPLLRPDLSRGDGRGGSRDRCPDHRPGGNGRRSGTTSAAVSERGERIKPFPLFLFLNYFYLFLK